MKDTSNLQFTARIPTLEEFRGLRINAGWHVPPDPLMSAALSKTLFGVCAETPTGEAIGMGRVVGDGGIQLFITDVIVQKEWQNHGLGSKIMALLMEYVRNTASPATFVGLFSAFGRDKFYEKFGFIVRPNEKLGPGMMFVHRKPEGTPLASRAQGDA
jgi:GNAT superfamily N-acetyltransferase